MFLIYDTETGADLRRAAEPVLADGEASVPMPPSALLDPALSMWSPTARGFVDVPHLTGLQIIALYTAAQHARARRMLFATYPDGHSLAGELVDPDGLVQRIVDATLALKDAIPVTSVFHVNGTAFLRAVGVIESDAEADRIAAGIAPENAS